MSQDPSSTDPLSAAWSFGKLMPGFGFLEQWTKGASAAMPAMGQWVAPTLDPAELEKRIQDLRTVQFWLEQNARMIAMTIQALEVQRMTLDTLKGMNVPVDALRESLKARAPSPEPSADATAASAAASASTGDATDDAAGSADAAPAVDPMRWWGSLTKQFTDLAASTMQDALKTDVAAAGGAASRAKAKASKPAAKSAKPGAKSAATPRGKAADAPRQASTRAQPARAKPVTAAGADRKPARRTAPGASAED